MDTKDTIEKLKELDIFDELRSAMAIITGEIIKLESNWSSPALRLNGLTYWGKKINGIKLHPACKYRMTDKRHNKGISFGVIDWSHLNMLNGRNNFFSEEDYNEYMEKVESIDYSCFYEKTPKEILDILDETDKFKSFLKTVINNFNILKY